ncbi:hypothetical protein [Eubacterium sp. An3]|uniref:hypothetical protein n=1 Tax=Eubacterium sp. An3 TaxID=1965628 RepID=UPI000B38E884|nr:hypothetical protein [Eubacterium sp. An3]OUO28869.1 hypothetical protein B5F87_06425 [Eubacterium sp. An3]
MSERELLQMILSEVQNANTGLNDVKSEIADLKTDVSALKTDVSALKTDVSALKIDVSALKTDVSALKTDVSALKTDVSALKTDVDDLKLRTALIETTLENETNRNIKIIAEGHTDLSRKLDHVLQMESEKEMFLIRFNVLESEVQKMKQHFDSIA